MVENANDTQLNRIMTEFWEPETIVLRKIHAFIYFLYIVYYVSFSAREVRSFLFFLVCCLPFIFFIFTCRFNNCCTDREKIAQRCSNEVTHNFICLILVKRSLLNFSVFLTHEKKRKIKKLKKKKSAAAVAVAITQKHVQINRGRFATWRINKALIYLILAHVHEIAYVNSFIKFCFFSGFFIST